MRLRDGPGRLGGLDRLGCLGRLRSCQLRAQGGVLGDDVLMRRQLRLRPRDRRDLADRFGVLQVGVDRRDDDARLDGDQVDADQRHAHPGIDDDALVQDAIENVDETCSACCSFNCHSAAPAVASRYRLRRAGARAVKRLHFPFELPHLRLQLLGARRWPALPARRQVPVVPPPVEADLLGLVERADEQPDPDGEQLDFGQRHLDVAGDDQPLVEHAIEHVDEPGRAMVGWKLESHAAATITYSFTRQQLPVGDAQGNPERRRRVVRDGGTTASMAARPGLGYRLDQLSRLAVLVDTGRHVGLRDDADQPAAASTTASGAPVAPS